MPASFDNCIPKINKLSPAEKKEAGCSILPDREEALLVEPAAGL
jgi:hypothetical protein